MKFEVKKLTGGDDPRVIVHAIGTVDPDAKVDVNEGAHSVTVDSWLLAEEFLIAFEEAGYDVRITEG
ncbi:copper chaperone [Paraburkholderia aromaticivorans]|uniref:copper chaperone n=1 Tax=Paraburkholderia aromaticivorans TaxID=2026199 RepID=UPI001455F382|nr:copper chaperone [Paraburkholderia aromaticivorans]